jgi:ABC-2 type transport system ATP-binding protein
MITVRSITKSFGRVAALTDVSFDVPRGQVVGLLGSNGAGKTTTIRVITGAIPPDAGSVSIDGLDTVDESRGARARVGYLPESAPAYAEMAVDAYLAFRARLYGVTRRDLPRALDRVSDLCELREVRSRRVGQLSKGYRQRVGLAAALIHDPPVLILDEPGNALDPRQIRHTRALIRELGRTKAVLVSSHILPEVEQTCDRVVMMARGRVRVDADPRALLRERSARAPYMLECRPNSTETASSAPAAEHCRAAIHAMPDIGAVEIVPSLAEGWTTLRIAQPAGDDRDLREAILSRAMASGLVVRELTRERPSLERVFVELLEGGEALGPDIAALSKEPRP